MKLLSLATILVLTAIANAQFTKLQWTDLGSPQVDFYEIDVKPMPIVQPGTATLNFRAKFKRRIGGALKTDLNIIRTVSGLKIPIRCYLAAGIFVGSCSYTDLCKIVEQLVPDSFNPTACPPELLDFGIDCKCPFSIRDGLIEIIDTILDLPDASQSIATFLASGDFDITIKTQDASGPFANIRIQFTVKPK